MKIVALAIASCLVSAGDADAAESATGSGALALAALVGMHSPKVGAVDKHALTLMLDGNLGFPGHAKISVVASSVTCRASDVDISEHDCTLKFGTRSARLDGRAAHELYATLVENGIPSDGAAGSIYEALSDLSCTVKVAEVKERAGGGAACSYKAGPGS